MKDIKSYINESTVNESSLDNIIIKNLAELGEVDIVDGVKDVMGDDLDSADILKTYDFLKSKFGKNSKKWLITPCADYEKYILKCKEWAKGVEKIYKLGQKSIDILTGIGYVINGL